ncbi:YybH family protein [Amycolatopsis jejuensis]|uniref:YybH family protein n=1 Tax=Amycolatopsis jejuensis TaxID=330084 RepID=UPI00052776DE|nr:nuclear transport factor 2 family protein [Amycolatopsis jejuensis]
MSAEEVTDVLLRWATEGWRRPPDGPPFDFRAQLEEFYDWTSADVVLHDNADPQRRIARSAAEYAAIWDTELASLISLSNTVDGPPFVSVTGDLAYADVFFTSSFEFEPGRVDKAATRSSLLLRRTEGRWRIVREHGSALTPV